MSGKFKNYYQVLGLEAFADPEAVKSAFRRLARQHHPDLNPGNRQAEDKFKEINEAYEVLNNTAKRAMYDESLRVLLYQSGEGQARGAPSGAGKAYQSASGKPPPGPSRAEASDKKTSSSSSSRKKAASKEASGKTDATPISDLFDTFLKKGGFGTAKAAAGGGADASFTEGRFSAGPKAGDDASTKPKRGEDVVVPTSITPQEAEAGVIKTVNVQHHEICRRCSGTGKVSGSVCPACEGEKLQARIKKIDVRIPVGVKQGSRVRVAKEGGRGIGGGEPGDLFLQIQIAYDPSLRVEGVDVYGDLAISVTEAVLGAEVEVPTLNGAVKMTVPPLTSSGKVFRLKERGAQNGQTQGDHFVTVKIVAPESLSPREKELFEELARLRKGTK